MGKSVKKEELTENEELVEPARLIKSGAFSGKIQVQVVKNTGKTGEYTGRVVEVPHADNMNGFTQGDYKTYDKELVEDIQVGDIFVFSKPAIIGSTWKSGTRELAYIMLGTAIRYFLTRQDYDVVLKIQQDAESKAKEEKALKEAQILTPKA